MGKIYLPKEIVPLVFHQESAPLFFLAGPIRGGGDWQKDMTQEIFSLVPHANIACPCRWDANHTLAKHFHRPFSPAANRQTVWERHYLKQAGLTLGVPGCVIFWLGLEDEENSHPGPEPYAMDTRRELGKFIAYLEMLRDFPKLKKRLDIRIVIGGNKNFYGLSVILDELQNALGHPVRFETDMHALANRAFRIAFRKRT